MTRRALAAALPALLLGGCVTARVHTSDPDARIWVDGRQLHKDARVSSVGPPHTARVLVIAKDGRRAHLTVSREFSWFTFLAGLRTVGVCFVFCWTYPPEIVVPLPPARPALRWDGDPADDPWGAAADGSAWSKPPANATPNASANATSTWSDAPPPRPGATP